MSVLPFYEVLPFKKSEMLKDLCKVLRLSKETQVRNAAFRALLKLCTLGIIWESEPHVVIAISCRVVSLSYLAEPQINDTGEKQNSKIDSCLLYQFEYLGVKASFLLLNLEGHVMKLKCWQCDLFLSFIPSFMYIQRQASGWYIY